MPVAPSRGHTGRVAIASFAAIAVLAAVLWAVAAALSGNPDVEINLGDDRFEVGDAERIAAEIAERGPFLVGDVAGGQRDVIVQHLGDDPAEGWYAFDARPPGAARDCFAEWRPEREVFVDTCTGEEYPPDGDGLEQYPVIIRDGEVAVELRPERD